MLSEPIGLANVKTWTNANSVPIYLRPMREWVSNEMLTNENGGFDPLDRVHEAQALHGHVVFGKTRQIVEEFFHLLQIGPARQKYR